jgi:hypothetical protein
MFRREIVREDAKLDECHEVAKAGAFAHPLDDLVRKPF